MWTAIYLKGGHDHESTTLPTSFDLVQAFLINIYIYLYLLIHSRFALHLNASHVLVSLNWVVYRVVVLNILVELLFPRQLPTNYRINKSASRCILHTARWAEGTGHQANARAKKRKYYEIIIHSLEWGSNPQPSSYSNTLEPLRQDVLNLSTYLPIHYKSLSIYRVYII